VQEELQKTEQKTGEGGKTRKWTPGGEREKTRRGNRIRHKRKQDRKLKRNIKPGTCS
jgi:hypothetical protein